MSKRQAPNGALTGLQEHIFLDVRAFDHARIDRFRSTSALARAVGIERSRFLRIAKGAVPERALREQIAKALGVDAGALWKPIPPAGQGVAA